MSLTCTCMNLFIPSSIKQTMCQLYKYLYINFITGGPLATPKPQEWLTLQWTDHYIEVHNNVNNAFSAVLSGHYTC